MSHMPGLWIPFLAAAALTAQSSQDAPQSKLTAREMFYDFGQSAAAPDAAKPKNPPKAPPVIKKAPPVPTRAGQVKPPDPPPPVRLPGGASVIRASAGPALGLKYTIVRRTGAQSMEVPADTVFHAKEAIQLKVQTNGPGYLYVVNQGSSGTWKPMFPAPEIAGGNNHVETFGEITLPDAKHQMTFDEHTGTENLFLIFSREPVSDLEELIYSLRDASAPAAQPAKPSSDRVVVARADIGDSTVDRLRRVYARDLLIEPVTPETPADASAKKETAVYVVNPNGSADSRLVADLHLRHQ